MADNHESTMKWKVDITQFKAAMGEAKRSISLANAEFKNATAGMGQWSKSTDGLQAKIKQLTTQLDSEKRMLAVLNSEYEKMVSEGKEGTAAAEKLKTSILNQEAAVKKTESQIAHYNDSLGKLEAEEKEAETATGKLTKEISEQEAEVADLKKQYKEAIFADNKEEAERLAKEIDELSGELAENKSKMAEAERAADELDRSLDDVGDSAEEAEGGFSVFKGAIANFAADIALRAVDALKNIVSETIEVGKNFDSAMSNVSALSGATGKDLEMLRDTAKEFGSSTQFSASQAADALGYMALAGWDAQTSASALGGVLDLAAASGMDLAAASDMVTDYMSAFNMEASQSAYFADVMAYAQANANTNVEQLGEAFKNSAANMNAAGQDVETTTSLLAMMANQGLKGSEAGTALTAVMRDMTAKMKDGKIAIGDTTVEVMDANGNYRDMTDILKDVENATDGMGDAEKATALMTTFTSDSVKGLNLLLNAGVDSAASFEEELRNSSGTAKETAKVMNDNLGGDLTSLGSKIEGVQIAMYEKFEPAMRKGVEVLSSLADAVMWVIDHGTEVIAVLAGMGAGIAAYVAYTTALKVMREGWMALSVVQKIVAGTQAALNAVMALNPIGLVIAAIVALVAAFVVLWNKSEAFRNFWIELWDKVKAVAETVWNAIVGFFKAAWENIKTVWSVVSAWFQNVWQAISNVFSGVATWFQQKFQAAWNAIKAVWGAVSGWFQGVWNGITAVFSNVVGFYKGKFQAAWDAIKAIWGAVSGWFKGVWNGITGVFGNVAGWFRGKFQAAWDAIKNVFSGWGRFFSNLWNTISSTFSRIGTNIANAISGAVRSGLNGVIRMIENTINGGIGLINGAIGLINKLPGVSVGTIGLLHLPRLARGGIVKAGQAFIAGEAGAEAIIPLENNTEWIGKVAAGMIAALRETGFAELKGESANGLNRAVSGMRQEASRTIVFNQVNNSPKALDRLSIYRQTNSLLFSAKVGLTNV